MLEEAQESTRRPPGPRSRFGKLTPKRNNTSKLRRKKLDSPTNSSLNVGDVSDTDDQNGQGGDASGVDGPVLGTASVSRTSAFRSFLAQRGAGSAAALALKDGFGRILNSGVDDNLDGLHQDRLHRGETIGEDRYQTNRALSLEHGELPQQGRDTSTKPNSRPSQLQQRFRNHRLNRSDLDLMRSKKKGMFGGVNRQQKPPGAARSPASLSPVSSESSSTTSDDDTDGQGPSSWLKGASRINKFVQNRGWGGRTTETTVSKGLSFPCCESRVSLLAACRNIWIYLRGCRESGKVGGPHKQVIPGVGRAASGRLENAAYERFGGFVGRGWPRKGLASFPMYHLEEHLQKHARAWRKKAAVEDAAIRIRVLGASILPEDPRITTPIVIVHVIDSSNGCYLAKTARTKDGPGLNAKNAVSDRRRSQHRRRNKNGAAAGGGHDTGTAGLEHSKQGCSRGSSVMERPDDGLQGGVSTTFERKTVWNLSEKPAGGEKVRTGLPCNTVPAIATQPSIMTMSSSTPAWDETFVLLERYHRLLVPECLLLFELVDFATAVPRKEARKGGGLLKIAWGFLRPIGAGGECNIDVRGRDDASPSCVVDSMDKRGSGQKAGNDRTQDVTAGETDIDNNRTSTLQLYEYRPLSVQARWQARHRGFPRLAPPVAAEVPDVFLQFLLYERKRYPATLRVSVGPIAHPEPVWVTRRPTASHEHEIHRLSFKGANSAKRETQIEDGGKDEREEEAGSIKNESTVAGAEEIGNAGSEQLRIARSKRLREKNKPCLLPDRLLHRVYAGQNGAITLAFSGSGALLAAACCDEPLLGRFPIRLFDSETGKCRHELKGHASMVYSLEWSPGDSLLLSASADGTAKVWRIAVASDGVEAGGGTIGSRLTRSGKEESPRLISVLQHAPPCYVYAAVFQPLVLEISRGARLGLEKHPKSEAKDCALVVTGAYDRQLRLWDVSGTSVSTEERAKLLGTLSNKVVHESHVNAIVYDSRNGRLYSGDGVGAVVVWRRASGTRGGVDDYSVLRKVQHIDLIGKAITSLALAPRLRRGQLLVQAHGNTLRLLNLGTYKVLAGVFAQSILRKLVNPGFAGDSATGSLVRASFSPDGQFVVSGSEKGQVRVWDAQGGKRVRTPLQALGTACCLRDLAWHPNQHVLALAGYGPDSPILLYYSEATAGNQTEVMEPHLTHRSSSHAIEVSAEEHRRSLENRQRLREIRVKRLRAKALGSMERSPLPRGGTQMDQGAVTALNALTVGGRK